MKGVEAEGVIIETLRNRHRVRLTNGHECLCHESGKIITRKIRVTVGDSVKVELSPYDLTRGRITYRL
jgi:translation initiation factor IF-1